LHQMAQHNVVEATFHVHVCVNLKSDMFKKYIFIAQQKKMWYLRVSLQWLWKSVLWDTMITWHHLPEHSHLQYKCNLEEFKNNS
jgi:hypothetical protein